MSLRNWSEVIGASVVAGLLAGCTTTSYTTYSPPPPPPPPAEVYVTQPPPEPDYTPPPPVYSEPAAPVVVVEIRSESDFYEPLGHYGRWVDVGGYGRCWTPGGVEHDWRPYTNGHWDRTDDGWYWVSDEPWGWATCHYGRWFLDPNFGWVWVPQTQWAPAWVAWRDGDAYTGWAPLPPRARFQPDGALERPDADIDPRSFVFVEKRRILEPQRPQTVIINNLTVVQKTVNVTKIVVVNKTVINEGPSPDAISRVVGHPVHVDSSHVLRTQREAPAIAEDHLRTTTVQSHPTPPAAQGRPERQRPDDHAVKQNEVSRQPEQVQIHTPPNPPHLDESKPAPRPLIIVGQPKNVPNAHTNLIHQHPQNLNRPVNEAQPHQPNGEVNHPVPSTSQAEPRPEYNNNQHPPVPPQHENGLNRPPQQGLTPQQKQEQQQELEKQKKNAEKIHPQPDKNHHPVSTNAPPQQK